MADTSIDRTYARAARAAHGGNSVRTGERRAEASPSGHRRVRPPPGSHVARRVRRGRRGSHSSRSLSPLRARPSMRAPHAACHVNVPSLVPTSSACTPQAAVEPSLPNRFVAPRDCSIWSSLPPSQCPCPCKHMLPRRHRPPLKHSRGRQLQLLLRRALRGLKLGGPLVLGGFEAPCGLLGRPLAIEHLGRCRVEVELLPRG